MKQIVVTGMQGADHRSQFVLQGADGVADGELGQAEFVGYEGPLQLSRE